MVTMINKLKTHIITFLFGGMEIVAKLPFSYYILYLLPDNRRIILKSDDKWTSARFVKPKTKVLYEFIMDSLRYFVKLCSRFSKNKKEILRKVRYYDGQAAFKMVLNVNEFSQNGFYFGFSENQSLQRLLRSRRNGVFIDIGANVGFFSLIGSLYFDQVVAFEPTPHTYQSLQRNVNISGAMNVITYPYAFSDEEGKATLYEFPLNQGGNSLERKSADYKKSQEYKFIEKRGYEERSYEVGVRRLDNIVEELKLNRVDFIKFDVEGHELNVLKGSINTLNKFHPVLFVEITSANQFLEIREVLPCCYKSYDSDTMSEISGDICSNKWRFSDILFLATDKKLRI